MHEIPTPPEVLMGVSGGTIHPLVGADMLREHSGGAHDPHGHLWAAADMVEAGYHDHGEHRTATGAVSMHSRHYYEDHLLRQGATAPVWTRLWPTGYEGATHLLHPDNAAALRGTVRHAHRQHMWDAMLPTLTRYMSGATPTHAGLQRLFARNSDLARYAQHLASGEHSWVHRGRFVGHSDVVRLVAPGEMGELASVFPGRFSRYTHTMIERWSLKNSWLHHPTAFAAFLGAIHKARKAART